MEEKYILKEDFSTTGGNGIVPSTIRYKKGQVITGLLSKDGKAVGVSAQGNLPTFGGFMFNIPIEKLQRISKTSKTEEPLYLKNYPMNTTNIMVSRKTLIIGVLSIVAIMGGIIYYQRNIAK